jgi:hypothetical protein
VARSSCAFGRRNARTFTQYQAVAALSAPLREQKTAFGRNVTQLSFMALVLLGTIAPLEWVFTTNLLRLALPLWCVWRVVSKTEFGFT